MPAHAVNQKFMCSLRLCAPYTTVMREPASNGVHHRSIDPSEWQWWMAAVITNIRAVKFSQITTCLTDWLCRCMYVCNCGITLQCADGRRRIFVFYFSQNFSVAEPTAKFSYVNIHLLLPSPVPLSAAVFRCFQCH